jgi:hypothetical protein
MPCYVGARTHDKPQLPRGRGAVRMAAAPAVTGLTRPCGYGSSGVHGSVCALVEAWSCASLSGRVGVKAGRAGSPNVGSSGRCAAPAPAAKQARVAMGRDR